MFETRGVLRPVAQALEANHRQQDYPACWMGLRKRFHARFHAQA
jgi:homogentisate 1,2-dioxygenase